MTSLTTVEKVPYVIVESHQNRINYLPEETTVCWYRFHYYKSMIRSFAMNEKVRTYSQGRVILLEDNATQYGPILYFNFLTFV